ncbi:MAG TPA: hypothetical protein VMG59_10850 [Phycisphaerae bacterium]|nr:hypothetical protein [Phycisphaerae bacterium]
MKFEDLKFPIIEIDDEGWLTICDEGSSITNTTSVGFKHGVGIGNLLVDTDGHVVQIVNIKKLPNAKKTWDWSLLGIIPVVFFPIEVILSEPTPMSLDEIKKKVLESVTKHLNFWDENWDTDNLMDQIKTAQDTKEIIEAFEKTQY